MIPQILKYSDKSNIDFNKDSSTFVVHCSELQWGVLYPPTILMEGVEEDKTKFDFHKAYKNKDDIVCHCEYRSTHGEKFKLIVHTL